jgi:hypothetical protein
MFLRAGCGEAFQICGANAVMWVLPLGRWWMPQVILGGRRSVECKEGAFYGPSRVPLLWH